MSPVEARIFFVEDQKGYMESCTELLGMFGHRVVLTASSRKEVTEKIPLLKQEGVQVALVDGNLSDGDVSGADGRAVAKEIRAAAPDVKIIGISADRDIEGVDVNCHKRETPEKFLETVTKI